jgi:hypothetical protein
MTGFKSKKAAALDEDGMYLVHHTAQPAQEPICPECKAGVLYECVACSSNNYPPQQFANPMAWAVYDKRGGSKSLHWPVL